LARNFFHLPSFFPRIKAAKVRCSGSKPPLLFSFEFGVQRSDPFGQGDAPLPPPPFSVQGVELFPLTNRARFPLLPRCTASSVRHFSLGSLRSGRRFLFFAPRFSSFGHEYGDRRGDGLRLLPPFSFRGPDRGRAFSTLLVVFFFSFPNTGSGLGPVTFFQGTCSWQFLRGETRREWPFFCFFLCGNSVTPVD